MIGWLFNLTYVAMLVAFSPWLFYVAWRTGKYREGRGEKLLGTVPPLPETSANDDTVTVWFHAVSVGEVKQLATLFDEIVRRQLPWRCVVSTTTKTGHRLAQEMYADKRVFYCPLDFTWAVNRALSRIRPRILVLAELELWPNLVRAAGQHGAAVAIVNGRLSARSFRGYRRLGILTRRLLQKIDLAAVQTPEYAERFQQLGIPTERLVVTGTLKFDGLETNPDNPASNRLRALASLDEASQIFIAGSTCNGEEPLVLAAYQRLLKEHPALRLILVPRHPERFDAVADMLREQNIDFTRRSQLDTNRPSDRNHVLLVDTIGELSAWWALADVAFVGGSLSSGRGGQNMIEPAAYGAAVCFGPDTRNFRDVVENLLARNAAQVVHDVDELAQFVSNMLHDRDHAVALGNRAASYVTASRGAASRTVDALESLTAVSGVGNPAIRPAA